MYLKAVKIKNFRKFGVANNEVQFADAEHYEKHRQKEDGEVNVATTVTLVVGKNNAGKTTIIRALDRLVRENDKFGAKDFNIDYLRERAEEYRKGCYDKMPSIEFEIVIGLDKGKEDYVTNIIPFLTIGNVQDTEIVIYAKYELREQEMFVEAVREAFRVKKEDCDSLRELSKVIEDNQSLFKVNYYNTAGKQIEKFRLSQLIEFVPVEVTNIESGNALSQAFNRIIKYRYEHVFASDKKKVEVELETLNKHLTGDIDDFHTKKINSSLGKIISDGTVKVNLYSDVTFAKLMNDLIKYEYLDGDKKVPESQFGMGYSNLMMIIANLVDYIEKRPDDSFNSKINIISIEEPETHMHPQMQELFIQYINDAINTLLEENDKHINSQLLITTHSSHIVNSKIQTGGTFNHINYVTERAGCSSVVILKDDVVTPSDNEAKEYFKFIKKHIKFGVSDALFADAMIMVEGVTESTLLPYYIAEDPELKHKYISIVKIDGAHAFVYKNLLKTLGIPTAIVTDLDIERSDEERNNYTPVTTLNKRKTTNKTIKNFYGTNDIEDLEIPIICENISVFCQGEYKEQYRTSFEEAFIACNEDNEIVNSVLKEMKPCIYQDILGNPVDYQNNSIKAYKWQKKLSDSKSEFANNLLYKVLIEEDRERIPRMPDYIQDALEFIKQSLKGKLC